MLHQHKKLKDLLELLLLAFMNIRLLLASISSCRKLGLAKIYHGQPIRLSIGHLLEL